MNNPIRTKNRRQFLLGAGGAALAIPLLPSLAGRRAEAALAKGGKSYAHLQLPHGAVLQQDMYPAEATLTETRSYGGHTIRRGTLQAAVGSGEARLSNVLRAPSTELTSGLVGKMNVIRGVDMAHYPAHGAGQALGNFGDMTGGTIDEDIDWKRPTIDQVMAASPSFYPSTPAERSLVLGDISWQYENPTARSGAVKPLKPFSGSNVALFDKLFGAQPNPGTTPMPPDTRLVDKVLENYKRVRNGGKLAKVDQTRLDDHMQFIAELQAKLSRPLAGTTLPRPTKDTSKYNSGSDEYLVDPKQHVEKWDLWTDVAAAAISVGASRIFVGFPADDTFASYAQSWHDLAHSAEAKRGQTFAGANQLFFSKVVLGLARKLDGLAQADGTSVLDSTLLVYTHESGSLSHSGSGMSIVTFGSAQGFLRTGQYVDYRNLAKAIKAPAYEDRWHGLVWHQWLGTVLQAMGVPATDYDGYKGGPAYPHARSGDVLPGFEAEEGTNQRYAGTEAPYPDAVWNVVNEPLPWLKA